MSQYMPNESVCIEELEDAKYHMARCSKELIKHGLPYLVSPVIAKHLSYNLVIFIAERNLSMITWEALQYIREATSSQYLRSVAGVMASCVDFIASYYPDSCEFIVGSFDSF
jgi:hypothetical protein